MIPLSDTPATLWFVFLALFVVVIWIDLGLGQRKAHAPSMKEAACWSAVWVCAALIFNVAVWRAKGFDKALEFFTGYIIEYSLSVDNLFVFVMIFSYFGVKPSMQPRVLKWGIIGAIIMRAIFIALGAILLAKFKWMIYVFGAFLVFTGIKMLGHKEEEIHPERNIFVKLTKRFIPVSPCYDGSKFFTRINGALTATPLFVVLLVVESTDVIFALDSIPAIYGITKDPFIVYTSNMFAIMGLRSLYFLLAGMLGLFRFLKIGVAVVLTFIGLKMVFAGIYHIPIEISLLVIFLILGGSIGISLKFKELAKKP